MGGEAPGQLDLLDDGARAGQLPHHLGGVGADVLDGALVEGPSHQADARRAAETVQRGAVVRHGLRGGDGVPGVVAGHGMEHDGRILDGPREDADGVQGPGE